MKEKMKMKVKMKMGKTRIQQKAGPHRINPKKFLFLGLFFSFIGGFSFTGMDDLWAANKKPRKTSVKEGLRRLKENYNHSRANLGEYRKNLNIVTKNLNEMDDVLKMIAEQEQQVRQAFKEHQLGLSSVKTDRESSDQLVAREGKLMEREKKLSDKVAKAHAAFTKEGENPYGEHSVL